MKRFKRLTVGTLAALGLFTAIGLAWFVLGLVEGTGTAKTGTGTTTNVPIKVVFHAGLSPTQEEPIEHLTIESPSGAPAIAGKKMTFTFTDSNEPACLASNFSIVPTGTGHFEATKFWGGEEYTGGHYFETAPGPSTFELIGSTASTWEANIKMAAAAPAACENVNLSLKVKVN